jgi:hypothetical protein
MTRHQRSKPERINETPQAILRRRERKRLAQAARRARNPS